MTIITKEQRVPRGRPKIYDFKTKQEYFRHYYKNNRGKWNRVFFCDTCQLYSSYANKTRHNKSMFHLNMLSKANAQANAEAKAIVEVDAQAEAKAQANADAIVEAQNEAKEEAQAEEALPEKKLGIKLESLFSEDIVA